MRPLALVAALSLLSAPAYAEETCPPVPPPGERHIVLEPGQLAPSKGVFASDPLARYDLRRLQCAESARDICFKGVDEKVPPGIMPYVWGGAAGVAIGVVLTLAVNGLKK